MTISGTLWGQRVSFGAVGGVNLTRDFPTSRSLFEDPDYPDGLTRFDLFSDRRGPIAGLSVEFDFGRSFSLEADALHRKLEFRRRLVLPDGTLADEGRQGVHTWEWPILLKYRLGAVRAARPFVAGGPSFRTRHNPAPTEPSQVGATLGAGVEFSVGRIRVSPAVRYTRWKYDGDFPRYASKRDQIELVAGFSYATSVPSWRVGGKKLRFGLIGGVPLTGGLQQPPLPERIEELQGFMGGLAVEVEWSRRLSLEVNGLYRPFRADRVVPSDRFGEARMEFTVLTWQFPVLAKYRFRPEGRLRPVVAAGPSFRLSGNRNGYEPSSYGFTAGGGLEMDYRALRFGPVLRYTRWAGDAERFRMPPTARNQVELLFSFTF